MVHALMLLVCGVVLALAVPASAWAQRSVADLLGRSATPEGQSKTYSEEVMLFGYVENSYVANLGHAGRDGVNELRSYDFDEGYSFNMAEISIKKDPSDRYRFGYGFVLTGGQDAQKNHAIGIFRDKNDIFPFRNTSKIDLQEVYVSYKVPAGSGLTVKGGKFATLIGYEVIESPNNLNFSRSLLFYATPFTHVGALATYPITDGLSVTAGPVVGWDIADDNNGTPSWTGQFALTPIKDLITNLNWISGKEYSFDALGGLRHGGVRTLLDLVVTYTGIKNLTLGANVDYAWEKNEGFLKAINTREGHDATWWGCASYVAYDWTEVLRTALRAGYFTDPTGARTGAGQKVSLWETTATVQYKIWKGLVGRLEYRHDQADEKVFKVRTPALAPTSKSQDTLTLAMHFLFF